MRSARGQGPGGRKGTRTGGRLCRSPARLGRGPFAPAGTAAAPLTVRAGLVRRVLVPAPVTLQAQAVQQVELVVEAAQVVGVAEESLDLRDDPFGVESVRLHRVSFLASCR